MANFDNHVKRIINGKGVVSSDGHDVYNPRPVGGRTGEASATIDAIHVQIKVDAGWADQLDVGAEIHVAVVVLCDREREPFLVVPGVVQHVDIDIAIHILLTVD